MNATPAGDPLPEQPLNVRGEPRELPILAFVQKTRPPSGLGPGFVHKTRAGHGYGIRLMSRSGT